MFTQQLQHAHRTYEKMIERISELVYLSLWNEFRTIYCLCQFKVYVDFSIGK